MFWFCVIFAIYNIFVTWRILESINRTEMIFLVIAEIVIEILVLYTLYRMNKKPGGIKVENQFLFLAVILGIMFILILPPGQSPDDEVHFGRAYAISQGEFIPEMDNGRNDVFVELPEEISILEKTPSENSYQRIYNGLWAKTGEVHQQKYTAAALYNFVCYIPQSIAIWVGRTLNLPIIIIEYLTECFNYFVWVLLVYFAIKFAPKFKKIFLFIALLPITLQEATSMSPDALTIGLSLFMVAYVLNLAYSNVNRKNSRKELVILYIVSIIMSLCKIVYLPLVLLLLVIPIRKFGSKKRKWLHLIMIYLLVLGINIGWLMVSTKYLVEINTGVDSGLQLKGIFASPINYVKIMLSTIDANAIFWMKGLLGTTLGAFVFNLPDTLMFVTFGIMVILFVQKDEFLRIKNFDRAVFSTVFLVISSLILTSLYLQWTPVGAEIISGIQGRYFLPILILLPIVFCASSKAKTHKTLIGKDLVLYYSVFMNAIALVTVFTQNI